MKIRIFPEHNYKAFHMDGKTIRLALNPKEPISELAYPEFYDVKVTSYCEGNCSFCYMNSLSSDKHVPGIAERFKSFFGRFNENQKPFQIALGGGSPESHREFPDILRACNDLGITPNYTTNGMRGYLPQSELVALTKELCGGVAVSTHPHLNKYWRAATEAYLEAGIHTNLHVIIGDRASIDTFAEVYKEYHDRVKYFVLLPLSAQGRSKEEFSDWDYLCSKIEGSPADVAFGAKFHPYLSKDKGRFAVSLYEPECMSAYLDLETMKVFKSSFSDEERTIGN